MHVSQHAALIAIYAVGLLPAIAISWAMRREGGFVRRIPGVVYALAIAIALTYTLGLYGYTYCEEVIKPCEKTTNQNVWNVPLYVIGAFVVYWLVVVMAFNLVTPNLALNRTPVLRVSCGTLGARRLTWFR